MPRQKTSVRAFKRHDRREQGIESLEIRIEVGEDARAVARRPVRHGLPSPESVMP